MGNIKPPRFHVGQKVICLESIIDDGDTLLTKDNPYTIMGIQSGCKHNPWVVDVNIPFEYENLMCRRCSHKQVRPENWWFNENLFAPIIELSTSTVESILAEIGVEELVKL
jgi:hypothetical protein